MNERAAPIGPLAREAKLVVRQLGDEILVYDLDRDNALCLNQTAAVVWKQCNGERSVVEITALVGAELGMPVDEQVVWFALDQLSKDGLLEETAAVTAPASGLSRRQLLKRAGVMAVAVPVVTVITAPSAWAAASNCLPAGSMCTAGQCCQPNNSPCNVPPGSTTGTC